MFRALWRLSLLFWFFVLSNLSAKLSNAEEFVWKSAEAHAEAIARSKATDRINAVEIATAEIDARTNLETLTRSVTVRFKAYLANAKTANKTVRSAEKVRAMSNWIDTAESAHEALVDVAEAARSYELLFNRPALPYSAAYWDAWLVKDQEAMEILNSELHSKLTLLIDEVTAIARAEQIKASTVSPPRATKGRDVVQRSAGKISEEARVSISSTRRPTVDELRQAQKMSDQLTARGIGITPAQALALIWTEQDLCGKSKDCE